MPAVSRRTKFRSGMEQMLKLCSRRRNIKAQVGKSEKASRFNEKHDKNPIRPKILKYIASYLLSVGTRTGRPNQSSTISAFLNLASLQVHFSANPERVLPTTFRRFAKALTSRNNNRADFLISTGACWVGGGLRRFLADSPV